MIQGLNSTLPAPQTTSKESSAKKNSDEFDGILSKKKDDNKTSENSKKKNSLNASSTSTRNAKNESRSENRSQNPSKSDVRSDKPVDRDQYTKSTERSSDQPNEIQTKSLGSQKGPQNEGSVEANASVGAPIRTPHTEKLAGPEDDAFFPVQGESDLSLNERLMGITSKENDGVAPTALTRRSAMLHFLSKMKTELNVEPTELVQAFSNLTAQELSQPPGDSVEAVVQQLGLTAEQADQARTYFNEMLTQTASTSMADYLKGSGSDLSIELLSKKQFQTNKLHKNLDTMSNSFFVDNKDAQHKKNDGAAPILATSTFASETGKAGASQSTTASANPLLNSFAGSPIDGTMGSASGMGGNQGLGGLEAMSNNQVPTNANLAPMNNSANAQQANQLNLNQVFANSGIEVQQPIEQQVMNSPMQSGMANPGGLNAPIDSSLLPNLGNYNGAGQVEASSQPVMAEQNIMAAAATGEGFGDAASQEFSEDGDVYSQLAKATQNTQVKQNANGEFVVNPRPQANEAQEAANIREVVNQAQYAIKKGGGEMKVQLNPHGLGEVAMKVNVENGRVNVEMVADTNDAKRVIEKGLGELKSTLAQHKLNVENIKVDTQNDTMNDMQQRHEDAERQFAQKFMNEFRQNNRQWQNGMLGLSGAKAYQSQTQDEANGVLIQNGQKKSSNAERRLDLVA